MLSGGRKVGKSWEKVDGQEGGFYTEEVAGSRSLQVLPSTSKVGASRVTATT